MHRALTISEILYATFSYISYDTPHLDVSDNGCTISHNTLTALAVTCRTFQDPALAVRWRGLYGVKPLLLVFPRDLWLFSDDTDGDQDDVEWELARLPSEEEWIRFERYTSRVRYIVIRTGDLDGVVHVMAALSMKYLPHPSQLLFPRLQSLVWAGRGTAGLPLVHLFLPPSLRCLELEFQGGIQLGVPEMLLLLEHQCPIFTELRIVGLDDEPHAVAVSRALETRSWGKLETLHCGHIDESALLHLARLPTLKNLSIHLPPSMSAFVAFKNGFTSLQILNLLVDDIGAIISFLGKITTTATAFIIVSHRLRLTFVSGGVKKHFDVTLDIAALRPLLSFSKLKSVYLDGLCSFNLNDDTLLELANAWPQLEKLALNQYTGWKRRSGITFKGLALLLRACPLLDTLALSLDAIQLSSISLTRPGEGIHNQKIKVINLGDSIIENPAAVALILRDLFSSLKYVDAWCSVYGREEVKSRYKPLWDDVGSHLRIGQNYERGKHGTAVNR
ncbi:hypothetical protein BJ138DRAFT_1177766 [Hygrophoropsis aurantiaca]|uniref:Uncharacterized protein n=1 Tax=Hygrophoropsis aurantiaca TaxID=72124 RepID=A0ACB8AKU6_9AGAM|nr:hypothetical protein BJ138DRAFT_1177766 [Hygrophoropsis aurantiaca]